MFIELLPTRTTGLSRWYTDITITILDINHRPVFYLSLNLIP
jgi:hypothetical protein